LLAFGGGAASESAARAMLATVDRKQVVRIAQLLGEGDPGALLEYARALDEWAPDYGDVLDALATLLVRVAMKQALPAFEGDELHPAELLTELAAQLAAEDVQLFYQTAILGRRDLAYAPDPRTGFEMTLLRMLAFKPGGAEPIAAGATHAASQTTTRPAATAGGASRASAARSRSMIGVLRLRRSISVARHASSPRIARSSVVKVRSSSSRSIRLRRCCARRHWSIDSHNL
jgi:DNA polymerase III subunit gamma/tau